MSSTLSGIQFIFPVILGTTVTFNGIILPSLRVKVNLLGLHSIFFSLSDPKVTTDSFSVRSKGSLSSFANFSVMYDRWLPESKIRQTETAKLSCRFLTVVIAICIKT